MKNYNEFLLESKNISFECLDIRDNIFKNIDLVNKWNKLKKSSNFINTELYKFDFNKVKFKLENLQILIKIFKYKENVCNGVIKNLDTIKFDNDILKDAFIEFDVYINELNDDFLKYVESTILHELIHLYEQYNLNKNNKFRPKSWSIGNLLPHFRRIFKNEDTLNIIDLLYKSLKNEISSQLHQYYDFKINDKIHTKIFDIKNDLEKFDTSKLKITDNFITDMEEIRKNICESMRYYTTNKLYIKNINKSFWNEKINKNNINQFLDELKSIFLESAKYIDEKIKSIDRKHFEPDFSNGEITEKFKNSF